MTIWALIEDGKVSEITDIDPSDRFHHGMKWLEAPEETLPGWLHDEDQGFSDGSKESPSAPSREEIERLRLVAYADPIRGSDRYFSEAARMQMMGEDAWEQVRDQGADRYREIQAAYPWQ